VASTLLVFLKGRYLADGVMVMNETIDFARQMGKRMHDI
jgi:hypothetical protein